MMKMGMRLDKSQITPITWRWQTLGAGTWKKDLYVMAGYTDFDVMVVGGAGGPTGRVQTTDDYFFISSGGGGAMYRKSGKLKDLPSVCNYFVGAAGTKGADKLPLGTAGYCGYGTDGQASWFGYDQYSNWARGEGGGRGERGYVSQSTMSWGQGGFGGGYGNASGGEGAGSGVAGTDGGLVVGSDYVYSTGGGGSTGLVKSDGVTLEAARAGKAGAVGAGNIYRAPGEAIQSTNFSGGGGGANIAPFTGGAAEYFGTGWNNTVSKHGIVLLRVS